MAVRPKGTKAKDRCVSMTDADWARICQAADAADLSNSEYIRRCCLSGQTSTGSTAGGLPPSVLRRAVRAVLVLEGLEQRRLEIQGAGDLWQKLVADADAEIDREACLG